MEIFFGEKFGYDLAVRVALEDEKEYKTWRVHLGKIAVDMNVGLDLEQVAKPEAVEEKKDAPESQSKESKSVEEQTAENAEKRAKYEEERERRRLRLEEKRR